MRKSWVGRKRCRRQEKIQRRNSYWVSSRQLDRKPVNKKIRPTIFSSSRSLQLNWLLVQPCCLHPCSQAAICSTVFRSVRTQLSRLPRGPGVSNERNLERII